MILTKHQSVKITFVGCKIIYGSTIESNSTAVTSHVHCTINLIPVEFHIILYSSTVYRDHGG